MTSPQDPRRESLRKYAVDGSPAWEDGPSSIEVESWYALLVEVERERDEARELAESNRNGSMEQELIYRANEIKRVEAVRDEARMAAVGGFPKMLAQVNQLQIELDKARAQLERAYHSHGMLSKVEAERDTALRDLAEARANVGRIDSAFYAQQGDFERLKDKLVHAYETIDTYAGQRDELAKALRKIADWQLPRVQVTGGTASYESEFGSNGARDYVREAARTALARFAVGKEPRDG